MPFPSRPNDRVPMTDSTAHRLATRCGKTLAGGLVVLLTLPTGIGIALGGWLAGHRTTTPGRGAVAGGVAGLLGALPWTVLVYLASAGAFEPIGYHENGIHIGINTAAPGALAPWQEVGLAVMFATVLVAVAVGGGIAAGLPIDLAGELREELSNAN
jgi:hypothetical protein